MLLPKPPKAERTSDLLARIAAEIRLSERITVGALMEKLGNRAFGVAILLFSLPNSLPVPGIPGFSTITGLPILLFAVQLLFARRTLWLPHWAKDKTLPTSALAHVLEKAIPYLRKLERLLRPRLTFMTSGAGEVAIGIIMIVNAVLLAMPIPFANFPCGLVITLLAIGLIERDGFLVLGGLLAGCFTITFVYSAALIILKKSVQLSEHFFW